MNLKNKFEQLEKNFYDWVVANRYKIVFSIGYAVFIVVLSLAPYINLYLTKQLVPVIILISLTAFFNLSINTTLKITIFLFLIACLLNLLRRNELAELVGNYIFAFILITVIRGILSKETE